MVDVETKYRTQPLQGSRVSFEGSAGGNLGQGNETHSGVCEIIIMYSVACQENFSDFFCQLLFLQFSFFHRGVNLSWISFCLFHFLTTCSKKRKKNYGVKFVKCIAIINGIVIYGVTHKCSSLQFLSVFYTICMNGWHK